MPPALRPRRPTNPPNTQPASQTTCSATSSSSSLVGQSDPPARSRKTSSSSKASTAKMEAPSDNVVATASMPYRALSPLPGTPNSGAASPSSAELFGMYGPRPVRAQFACDYCRQRKAKCSGTEPCDRCVSKKQTCSFSTVQNQRKVTRSLKDLHAERLGLAHYASDPSLKGGVRMYLDRHAQRVGMGSDMSGQQRRLVMSQGDGAGHVNHWYWALQQQAQQRGMGGSGRVPYLPSSHPATYGRYQSGGHAGAYYPEQVWAANAAAHNASLHPYSYGNQDMGSRSESDLSSMVAGSGAAGMSPSGSNTPVSYPHTPSGSQAYHGHNALQLTTNGAAYHHPHHHHHHQSGSRVAHGGYGSPERVDNASLYQFSGNYATSADPNGDAAGQNLYQATRSNGNGAQAGSANMYSQAGYSGHSEGGGGQTQSIAGQMGWRYEPLPPPPASAVLGQESEGANGDGDLYTGSGGTVNPEATSLMANASAWQDSYTNVGISDAAATATGVDLGFRPPSPTA